MHISALEIDTFNLRPFLDTPVCNIVPNLVYAACAASRAQRGSGHEVKTVVVAGRVLVRDGEVPAADEDAVWAEAQEQAEAVVRCVAADPVHRGMALLDAMEADQL